MRRVVLFYPSLINGDESPTLYTALPLSLVALAAPLRAASFEVEILDERLHIYTEEEIGKQLEGAVLVGISAITSYQIVNGLRFARSVRRLAPHIPIVWGRLASYADADGDPPPSFGRCGCHRPRRGDPSAACAKGTGPAAF